MLASFIQEVFHVSVVADFSPHFEHPHVLRIMEEVRRENETIEFFVLVEDDFLVGSFPFLFALVHVDDFIADLHDAVHVVRIHHRGDVEINGDFPDQFVDYQGSLRIQA
jgi:hypothetical protein